MSFTFTPTTASADAPVLPDGEGLYDARWTGVEDVNIPNSQFGDGASRQWNFTLVDDDGADLYDRGEPIEVRGLTSRSMNLTSKTKPKGVKYLEAILTPDEFAEFARGEGFDAERAKNRIVQVDIVLKDSGWPNVVNVLRKRARRGSQA
jgi:hypothetical protein